MHKIDNPNIGDIVCTNEYQPDGTEATLVLVINKKEDMEDCPLCSSTDCGLFEWAGIGVMVHKGKIGELDSFIFGSHEVVEFFSPSSRMLDILFMKFKEISNFVSLAITKEMKNSVDEITNGLGDCE